MQGPTTSRRLAILTLSGLLAGGVAWLAGAGGVARAAWALTTAAMLVPLSLGVARSLLRREVGVDVIALLAMAGALATGEYLAGAVVALMLAGGLALEGFADARARAELSALIGRVPRSAHRYQDGDLVSLPVEEVRAGDRLLVKPGEMVPVDGVVAGAGADAVLDESALTGEARPVERQEGDPVKSGTVNAGGPFDLRAVATAAASTYAAIVRLVEEAQASKAPFVRLADRYALVFLPLTLLVAAAAWIAGGSPVRAVAVLVVATPCPLILAAPVALIAGVSACAKRGVIVKGGGALEALAVGRVLLLDKTGTLTTGVPELAAVEVFGELSVEELLRLAASLDQVSPHVFAAAVVRGARERGLKTSFPVAVEEHLGAGIRGTVEGHVVALGRLDWIAAGKAVPPRARQIRRRAALEGASNVFVAVDGAVAGAVILRDPVRADTPATLRALRRHGIRRVVMVTGDAAEVAEPVAAAIGADLLLTERTPEEKVAAVKAERAHGPTIMVGDGVNDAPALAAADVGVAMGARGATASSEAADVVITLDRLDRLAEALQIARRARRIALESVLAGMGLSLAAMLVAAAGYLPPVAGALLQEAIDVAVIVNALRALAPGREGKGRGARRYAGGAAVAAAEHTLAAYRREHRELLPEIERLRTLADQLEELPPSLARLELARTRRFLDERLVPHEVREDEAVYPLVARAIGGHDPTAAMSRGHLEIAHLARLFSRLAGELGAGDGMPRPASGAGHATDRADTAGPSGGQPAAEPPAIEATAASPASQAAAEAVEDQAAEPIAGEDLRDLRRLLYGLHAILRLHFAQEEENYLPLLE